MLLLTKVDGSQILIGDNGLCIESEPNTERCIVILPHYNYRGKSMLTVTESFDNIVIGLSNAGHLIRPNPISEPQKAEPKISTIGPSEALKDAVLMNVDSTVAEEDAAIGIAVNVIGPATTDWTAKSAKRRKK